MRDPIDPPLSGGTVTALVVQKRDKDRVNVYLDGEFAFGLDLMSAAELRKGQQLTVADVSRLRADDTRKLAYNRALRFLGYRPRSRLEVARYLKSKEYDADLTEDVIERLAHRGYVDDVAFARFWIDNRLQHRPRGAHALRHELRQKGISDAIIEEALAGLDEEMSAWSAVQSKLSLWSTLEEFDLRKKMTGFLARRGFGYDAIRATFDRTLAARAQDDDA